MHLSFHDNFLWQWYHRRLLAKVMDQLKKELQGKATDAMLELLFTVMRIALIVHKDYRKNIIGFTGSYSFESKDGSVAASAIFANGKMSVKRTALANPTVRVKFDSPQSVCDFLLNPDPNVFDFILENRLSYYGNLNYMMKFGYMAKKLKSLFGL